MSGRPPASAVGRALDGLVAIVTGGGSGIGRATAIAFARAGAAAVVVADVVEEGGRETAETICRGGGEASFIRTDVSRDADVALTVRETVRRYGKLDVAFNNAGIEGRSALTADMPPADFDRVIAVNLRGVWLCMHHELPELVKTKGALVNMSSVLGEVGALASGAYSASKHAVIGLTRVAALEYASAGVRVNTVLPGYIRTPMLERAMAAMPEVEAQARALHPMARIGLPEEVAAAVLWLVSPAASFVTGETLAVDGGYLAR